jgi:hypothetical protein
MQPALAMPEISPYALAQGVATPLALFASLLLGASALHKVTNPARARRAVGGLTGFGHAGATCAVAVAGAAEGLAAVGLLAAPFRGPAALLAAGVWAVYGLCIGAALLRGRRDLDCGCGFAAAHRPLGGFELLRNAVLVAVALLVALVAHLGPAAVGAGIWLDAGIAGGAQLASAAFAALALLALYAALDHVMAQGPLRSGVVR